jgi:hypothetical protein
LAAFKREAACEESGKIEAATAVARRIKVQKGFITFIGGYICNWARLSL